MGGTWDEDSAQEEEEIGVHVSAEKGGRGELSWEWRVHWRVRGDSRRVETSHQERGWVKAHAEENQERLVCKEDGDLA